MHNSTTALLRALLTNNDNVTIEKDRLRFFVGNRSEIEVIVTGEIAESDGIRGVIPAALLRDHVKASDSLALSLYSTEITISETTERHVTVQMVPDRGTFKVPSIVDEQPQILAITRLHTMELTCDDTKAIVAANGAAGDYRRAERFGTWLAEGHACATNGYQLEKRKLSASLPEAVLVPSDVVKALAKIKAKTATVSLGFRGEQRAGEVAVDRDGSSVQFRWLPIPASDMPPMLHYGEGLRSDVQIPLNWQDAWKLGAPMAEPRFGIFRNGAIVAWDSKNEWVVGTHFPKNEIPEGEPVVVLTSSALASYAGTKENSLYVASDSTMIRIRDRIVCACSTSATGEPFSTALSESTRAAVERLYDKSPCPPMTAAEALSHAALIAHLDARHAFTMRAPDAWLADRPKAEAMATPTKRKRAPTVAIVATMTRETILPRLPAAHESWHEKVQRESLWAPSPVDPYADAPPWGVLCNPAPTDNEPDTIRDPKCVHQVEIVEQKLVPYRREVSTRIAEIAQTFGVRKPVLYTVGLHKVTKAQFAHIARSVGASSIVFVGDANPMVKRILGEFVAALDTSHALAAVTGALANGQTVILAGSAVSPCVDGRHEVAQRVGFYDAWHIVPTDDSIIESAEFQASIDKNRAWDGYVLSEYLAEQAQEAAKVAA